MGEVLMENFTATEIRVRMEEHYRLTVKRRRHINNVFHMSFTKVLLRTMTNYGPIIWIVEPIAIKSRS